MMQLDPSQSSSSPRKELDRKFDRMLGTSAEDSSSVLRSMLGIGVGGDGSLMARERVLVGREGEGGRNLCLEEVIQRILGPASGGPSTSQARKTGQRKTSFSSTRRWEKAVSNYFNIFVQEP